MFLRIKKNLKFIILTLILSAVFVGLWGCLDHVHEYTESVVLPTCEEKGYTLHKCSCGDEYKTDETDALGHDYGEYVSNDDATIDEDGTKTRTCQRDGCEKTETVTDEGSKLVASSMTFKNISATEVNNVKNSVSRYCLKNAIVITGDVTYKVYKDENRTEEVNPNDVHLEVGENVFYIVANVGGNEEVHVINIEREGGFPSTEEKTEEAPLSSPITKAVEWNTYTGFSSTAISTSIATNVNIGTYTASNVNKYKIVYSLDKPVKGLITIGSHTEDFFLEAGTNVTFTSFTDDVLGDRSELNLAKSKIHATPYVAGKPLAEKVTNGKTFSGTVTIIIEPIEKGTVNFKPVSFSTAYQEVEERVVYIANERYRVGTHLYYGGSLTYFEDLQDGRDDIGNLINIHDGGRLVQQSYYTTDRIPYNGISYNPVQGGNGRGFSKLIDLEITEDHIYVKARAKNWNDQTETGLSNSYMENWYSLEEDYVRVDNSFVDFIPANNNDVAHETPAIYLVGALKNLAVYRGENHWTDDTLSYYDAENMKLGEGGVGHNWYQDEAESWGCWYNEQGWGVGFYVPNTHACQAWAAFSGDDLETYNPYANATTHFRLAQGYPIRQFEKVNYSYIITTGTPNEIRQTFKENREYDVNDFPISYADSVDLSNIDFSIPQTMGFTQSFNNSYAVYDESRDYARIVIYGKDPYFSISLKNAKEKPIAENYPYIAIEYMVPETFKSLYNGDWGAFYIAVGEQQGVVGGQYVSFDIVADGKWQIAYIDMRNVDWYKGNINLIRLDPVGGSVHGGEIYLKSIKLLENPPTVTSYEDTYVPTAKTWAEKGDFYGGYMASIDRTQSNGSYTTVVGWFLINSGINRFEYLIYEEGTITEEYFYSAESEKYWMVAPRMSGGARIDASGAFLNIGDDGSNAGFSILVPEILRKQGKNYKFALRVISNKGEACFVKTCEFPIP